MYHFPALLPSEFRQSFRQKIHPNNIRSSAVVYLEVN